MRNLIQKRQITIVFMLLVVFATLTGCMGTKQQNERGNSSGEVSEPVGSNDSMQDVFEYGNGTDYINSHLTGDYSITYKVFSTGNKEASFYTVMRTSEGYYFNISGYEVLYIRSGEEYIMYTGSIETGFTKVELNTFSKDNVEGIGVLLTGYMTQYGMFSSDMKWDGNETVAGHICNRYSYSLQVPGASYKYYYCIDKETGVCLKFTYDLQTGAQSGNITYECTEFLTSGVKLPTYV